MVATKHFSVKKKKGFFQWKGGRHLVNEGFGKDFHRKGNSVKRSGPFSEPVAVQIQSKKRKSSGETLAPSTPTVDMEMLEKTSKTMSTMAILWPVKAIFEKRAATVEVDTFLSPAFYNSTRHRRRRLSKISTNANSWIRSSTTFSRQALR